MVAIPEGGSQITMPTGNSLIRAVCEPRYEYWLGTQLPNTITFYKGSAVTKNGVVEDENSWRTGYIKVSDRFIFSTLPASVTIAFYIGLSIGTPGKPMDIKSFKQGHLEIPESANYFMLSCSQSEEAFATEMENSGIVVANTEKGDTYEADWIYRLHRVAPFCRNLQKKYTVESGWLFSRQSLSGTLSFHGDDYDRIWKSAYDSDFVFLIRHWKRVKSSLSIAKDGWEDYFIGTFAKTGCTFDYGKKKCTPKIEVLDSYKHILALWEKEVDLVKRGTPRTIIKDMAIRAVVQTYVAGSKTVCNFCGANHWTTEVDEAVDINYGKLGFDAGSSNQPLVKEYGFQCVEVYDEFVINGFDKDSEDAVMNGRYVRIGDSTFSNVSYVATNGGNYALDKVGYKRWMNENGCVCRVSVVTSTVSMQILSSIEYSDKAGSEGVLASSRNLMVNPNNEGYGFNDVVSGKWGLDKFFPTVPAVNPAEFRSMATGASRGVSECFSYYIYQRVLSVKDAYGNTKGVKLTEDDPFEDSGGNYKYAIPAGQVGTFGMSAEKADAVTPYGIDDNNKYFVAPGTLPNSNSVGTIYPLCRDSWGMASLWWSGAADKTGLAGDTRPVQGYSASILNGLTETYDHKDAFYITDALQSVLAGIGTSVKHLGNQLYSKFLYSGVNPVAGVDRFYVFLTQKTNVLKGDYDQAAQKCPVTLKGILEMLRDVFKCYWYLDDENRLCIEHVSYFLNGGSYTAADDGKFSGRYDFTELRDRFNQQLTAYFQTQLSFDREGSQIPREYALSWSEESSYVFDDTHIRLIGKNVDVSKKEDVTVSDFCADVDMMHFAPGDFSEEGVALLCPVKSGSDYVMRRTYVDTPLRDEFGGTFNPTVQNWYASLIHSAMYLYKYGLPAARYRVDKVAQSEFTVPDGYVKKIASQTLRFPSEVDPNENEKVKTEIGVGEIESMSVDLDSRTVEAAVVYDPTKIINV